jgi:hypothetical protein
MPHKPAPVHRQRLAEQPGLEPALQVLPLQLQLLGCSGAAGAARGGGAAAAACNTGLQDLTLHSDGWLSDDELALAAGALPDLRRLEVGASRRRLGQLHGLRGSGLADFGGCPRLRDVSLRNCPELQGGQLLEQLLRIGSLATLQVQDCSAVEDHAFTGKVQAAFMEAHGRQLSVVLLKHMQ